MLALTVCLIGRDQGMGWQRGIGQFVWWRRLRCARSGWSDGVGVSGGWLGISCFVASPHLALAVMFSILSWADGN